jgi:hypothetical protein
MTRKSLASAINRFEKDNRTKEWLLVGILFAGLIGVFVFLFNFPSALLSVGAAITLFCAVILWSAIPVCILTCINRPLIKQLNLKCPSCDVSLVGFFGRLAVATLHCGHCGAKIVEEEQRPNEPE